MKDIKSLDKKLTRKQNTKKIIANVGIYVMAIFDLLFCIIGLVEGVDAVIGIITAIVTLAEILLLLSLLPRGIDVDYFSNVKYFLFLFLVPVLLYVVLGIMTNLFIFFIFAAIRLLIWLLAFLLLRVMALNKFFIIILSVIMCALPAVQMVIDKTSLGFDLFSGTRELKYERTGDTYTVTGCYWGLNSDVVVPDKVQGVPVTKIAASAFNGQDSIKKVILPATIKDIGEWAFAMCSKLESVEIGGAEEIGSNAFASCGALKSVSLNMEVPPSIDTSAFIGSDNVKISIPPEGVDVFRKALPFIKGAIEPVLPEGKSFLHYETNDEKQYINTLIANTGTFLSDYPVLERDGYEFNGWYSDKDFATRDNGANLRENGKTIYAKWLKKYYVTLISGGGLLDSELRPYFTKETPTFDLPTVSRDGYEFGGWFMLENFSGYAIESVSIGTQNDLTFYAKLLKKYYVNLTLNGGTLSGTLPEYFTKETPTITLPSIAKRGYTFNGWYEKEDFSGNKVSSIAIGTTADKQFYAKFTLNNYTITYHMNGGEVPSGQPQGFTVLSPELTLLPPPERTGYTFNGYFENATFSGSPITAIVADSINSRNIYAKFVPIVYNIGYELNGGTQAVGQNTTYTIISEAYTLLDPVYDGYEFNGWYKLADFSGEKTTAIAAGEYGDTMFYAKWLKKYYVHLERNGGTLIEALSEYFTKETNTFNLPDATKRGYTFKGWYDNNQFSGSQITAVNIGTENDVSAFAKFDPIIYSISYTVNGGSLTGETIYYTIESPTFQLVSPTRVGYTFGGWYSNANFSGEQIKQINQGSIENKSYYAKWTLINYDIIYNTNDGTLFGEKTSYNIETPTFQLVNPTRVGYTFDGWYSNINFSGGMITQITTGSFGDHTLYAKWIANKYLVTFVANGGTGAANNITVTYDNAYGILPTLTKTGYTFNGWYTTDNDGLLVTSETTVNTASAHTLYAKWTANSYVVNFDTNGGTGAANNITVIYDSKYSDLPLLTKTGYTLNWYTANSGGTLVTSDTTVNTASAHTLYARWTANEYTVTFALNGGNSTMVNKPVTFDSAYGELPTPTKTGYTFNGWYTTNSDGILVTSETTVNTANAHILYARWSANSYVVNFVVNGGTGAANNITATYDNAYGTLPTLTKTGYTFNGWYTASDMLITSETIVATDIAHTLYARWKANEYTVTFETNGGTGAANNITATYDNAYGALPTLIKTGYTFNGWYTATDMLITSETIVATDIDHTLYAKWTAINYEIIYNKNGGTLLGERTSYNIETSTFQLVSPTRVGYTFGGWYSNADFSGDIVTQITVGSIGAHTLYARWTIETYIITYTIGDEIYLGSPVEYTIISDTITLPDPKKEGYTFDGWYTSAEYSGDKITAIIKGSIGNRKFFGKFTVNSYLVNFDKNGGEGEIPSREVEFGETYGILAEPSKAGYKFAGWWTDIESGSLVESSTIVPAVGEHTLYAHWTVETYTISYTVDGEIYDAPIMKYTVESEVVILPDPTKEGYTFDGWYTNLLMTGDKVVQIDKGSFGNKELFAKFVIIPLE